MKKTAQGAPRRQPIRRKTAPQPAAPWLWLPVVAALAWLATEVTLFPAR